MLTDQELLRYSRQILLQHVDIDGQLRLKQSRALINAALRDWQARGGQNRAWELRSNALLVDSLKIGDGLVCH